MRRDATVLWLSAVRWMQLCALAPVRRIARSGSVIEVTNEPVAMKREGSDVDEATTSSEKRARKDETITNESLKPINPEVLTPQYRERAAGAYQV